MKALSKAEVEALTWALHLDKTLDQAACSTGRTIRLRTMRKLEARGFVEEAMAYLLDDDGRMREPEIWRRCFKLTAAGRERAEAIAARRRDDALILPA